MRERTPAEGSREKNIQDTIAALDESVELLTTYRGGGMGPVEYLTGIKTYLSENAIKIRADNERAAASRAGRSADFKTEIEQKKGEYDYTSFTADLRSLLTPPATLPSKLRKQFPLGLSNHFVSIFADISWDKDGKIKIEPYLFNSLVTGYDDQVKPFLNAIEVVAKEKTAELTKTTYNTTPLQNTDFESLYGVGPLCMDWNIECGRRVTLPENLNTPIDQIIKDWDAEIQKKDYKEPPPVLSKKKEAPDFKDFKDDSAKVKRAYEIGKERKLNIGFLSNDLAHLKTKQADLLNSTKYPFQHVTAHSAQIYYNIKPDGGIDICFTNIKDAIELTGESKKYEYSFSKEKLLELLVSWQNSGKETSRSFAQAIAPIIHAKEEVKFKPKNAKGEIAWTFDKTNKQFLIKFSDLDDAKKIMPQKETETKTLRVVKEDILKQQILFWLSKGNPQQNEFAHHLISHMPALAPADYKAPPPETKEVKAEKKPDLEALKKAAEDAQETYNSYWTTREFKQDEKAAVPGFSLENLGSALKFIEDEQKKLASSKPDDQKIIYGALSTLANQIIDIFKKPDGRFPYFVNDFKSKAEAYQSAAKGTESEKKAKEIFTAAQEAFDKIDFYTSKYTNLRTEAEQKLAALNKPAARAASKNDDLDDEDEVIEIRQIKFTKKPENAGELFDHLIKDIVKPILLEENRSTHFAVENLENKSDAKTPETTKITSVKERHFFVNLRLAELKKMIQQLPSHSETISTLNLSTSKEQAQKMYTDLHENYLTFCTRYGLKPESTLIPTPEKTPTPSAETKSNEHKENDKNLTELTEAKRLYDEKVLALKSLRDVDTKVQAHKVYTHKNNTTFVSQSDINDFTPILHKAFSLATECKNAFENYRQKAIAAKASDDVVEVNGRLRDTNRYLADYSTLMTEFKINPPVKETKSAAAPETKKADASGDKAADSKTEPPKAKTPRKPTEIDQHLANIRALAGITTPHERSYALEKYKNVCKYTTPLLLFYERCYCLIHEFNQLREKSEGQKLPSEAKQYFDIFYRQFKTDIDALRNALTTSTSADNTLVSFQINKETFKLPAYMLKEFNEFEKNLANDLIPKSAAPMEKENLESFSTNLGEIFGKYQAPDKAGADTKETKAPDSKDKILATVLHQILKEEQARRGAPLAPATATAPAATTAATSPFKILDSIEESESFRFSMKKPADDNKAPGTGAAEDRKSPELIKDISFKNTAKTLNTICASIESKTTNTETLKQRLALFKTWAAQLVERDQWNPEERKKYAAHQEKNRNMLNVVKNRIEELTKLNKSIWVTIETLKNEIEVLNFEQAKASDNKNIEQEKHDLSEQMSALIFHQEKIQNDLVILEAMVKPLDTLVNFDTRFRGARGDIKPDEVKEKFARENCIGEIKRFTSSSTYNEFTTWVQNSIRGEIKTTDAFRMSVDKPITTQFVSKDEAAIVEVFGKKTATGDRPVVAHLITGNNIPLENGGRFNGVISKPASRELKLFETCFETSSAAITFINKLILDKQRVTATAKEEDKLVAREKFWAEFCKQNDFPMDENKIKDFLNKEFKDIPGYTTDSTRDNKVTTAANELFRTWEAQTFPALIKHAEIMNEKHFGKGKAYLYGNEHMRYAIKCYREARIKMAMDAFPEGDPRREQAKEDYKYVDTVSGTRNKPSDADINLAILQIVASAPKAMKGTDDTETKKIISRYAGGEGAEEAKKVDEAEEKKQSLISEEKLTEPQIRDAIQSHLVKAVIEKKPKILDNPNDLVTEYIKPVADSDSKRGAVTETATSDLLASFLKTASAPSATTPDLGQKQLIDALSDLAEKRGFKAETLNKEKKARITSVSPTLREYPPSGTRPAPTPGGTGGAGATAPTARRTPGTGGADATSSSAPSARLSPDAKRRDSEPTSEVTTADLNPLASASSDAQLSDIPKPSSPTTPPADDKTNPDSHGLGLDSGHRARGIKNTHPRPVSSPEAIQSDLSDRKRDDKDTDDLAATPEDELITKLKSLVEKIKSVNCVNSSEFEEKAKDKMVEIYLQLYKSQIIPALKLAKELIKRLENNTATKKDEIIPLLSILNKKTKEIDAHMTGERDNLYDHKKFADLKKVGFGTVTQCDEVDFTEKEKIISLNNLQAKLEQLQEPRKSMSP